MKINNTLPDRKSLSRGATIYPLLGLMLFVVTPFKTVHSSEIPIFTKIKVEQMISSLDEGSNLLSLKIRYFGGHTNSPFPAHHGFELLQEKLRKQEIGSIKWFQLESLKGYAAFHVPGVPIIEGYDAYGLLFDKNVKTHLPQAQTLVRASIRDFVNFLCHMNATLGSKHLSSDLLVRHLLLKAWVAWHRLPPSTSGRSNFPDWGGAIKAVNAQSEFSTIVEKTLSDPTSLLDFTTLKLAVVVLQDTEPQRAIELLKTAQTKMQPGNSTQQKWLYQAWMQLITGNDPNDQLAPKVTDKTQLTALVVMRRDQISYTGTGYAELLKLYWRLEQNDKANELIMVVKGPGIRASQKIDVAKVLLRPPSDLQFSKETTSQLQQQGVLLLQAYLAMLQENSANHELEKAKRAGESRPYNRLATSSIRLSVRNQLQARYELGRYFVKQDQITEALQALDIGDLKPASRHTRTAMYYREILKMKAELTENEAGRKNQERRKAEAKE